ncbi:MAG: response regulator [Victivallales bacterium]|nr:response regulator [Victivallales bacterium]
MLGFIKTKIGIFLLSFFSVILITSIALISYFSINSIEQFGSYFLEKEGKALEQQSLNSLFLNTTRIANECSLILNEDINTISDLRYKIIDVYENLDWYSEKNRSFSEKLNYIPANGLLTSPSKFPVETIYNPGENKSIGKKIQTELNALHSLDGLIKKFKDNMLNIKYIWLSTASGIAKFYPAKGVTKAKYYKSDVNFTFNPGNLKKNFFKQEKNIWTQVFLSPEGALSLSIVSPVYINKIYRCVIALEINLENIRNIIVPPLEKEPYTRRIMSQLGLSEQNFLAVDKQGNLTVFTLDQLKKFNIKDNKKNTSKEYYKTLLINLNSSENPQIRFLTKKITGSTSGTTVISINNKKYFFAYCRIAFTDLTLISYVPAERLLALSKKIKSSIEANKQNMLKHFIIITIILLITFIITTGFVLNYYFIKPLQILVDGMRSIAKGRLDKRIKLHRGKEIEEAALTFNNMAGKLNTSKIKLDNHRKNLQKTVRKKTKELAETNQQLAREKNKALEATEAKTKFLANMSHEIRSPMNAILGYSELLVKRVRDKNLLNKIEVIYSNSKNLLDIINEILDLSKIEAGKITLKYSFFDLRKLVENIIQLYSKMAQSRNLELQYFFTTKLPAGIKLDPTKVRQIISNIVSNAIKFTESGHVHVQISHEKKSDKNADIFINIKDTGQGIPDNKKKTIFEAFQQLDNQSRVYKGTGLGLNISMKLISMMKGNIEVCDNAGGGTVFKLSFYNVEISDEENDISKISTGEYENTDEIAFSPATVLVADDRKVNREIIKEFLNGQEIKVIEAFDGIDAVNKIKNFRPDLIIMDYRMPGQNGYDAVVKLKESDNLKNIPVIFITASVIELKEKIKIEGTEILDKPFTQGRLFSILKKHLNYKITAQQPLKNVKESSPQKALNSIAEKEKISLPKEYIDEWKILKKQFIINKMNNFAEKMKAVAVETDAEYLLLWSETVISSIIDNNLRKLTVTFNLFDKIVRSDKTDKNRQQY